MDGLSIVIAIYLIVSIFAVVMTYREQHRAGISSPLVCLVGFVACTLWPLPLTAMIALKAFGLTSNKA